MSTAKLKIVAAFVAVGLLFGGVGVQLVRQSRAQVPGTRQAAPTQTGEPGPRIAPGDRLTVTVSDLTRPGQPATATPGVSESGEIPVLLAGHVHVAGLTDHEAAAAIAKQYHDRKLIA